MCCFLWQCNIHNGPSPVIESRKKFRFRKSFCFAFLHGPMTSRKILVQTTKSPTSPKVPNFQNGRKPLWCPISSVGSKFKCLQLIYRWKGNFIRINIVLRTSVQKWTSFELLIENRRGMFLKVVAFLLKLGFHYRLMWDKLRKYLNIFFLSQAIPSGNVSQKLSHKIVMQ